MRGKNLIGDGAERNKEKAVIVNARCHTSEVTSVLMSRHYFKKILLKGDGAI